MSKSLPRSYTDSANFEGSSAQPIANAQFHGSVTSSNVGSAPNTIVGPKGDTGSAGANGLGWKSGGTGYSSSTGIVTFASNDGLEFDTGDLRGATGAAGADGATWSSGADVPANSTGTDGDFFFETDTDKVWKRISGTWTEVADLTGATGATGAQGPQGDTGATGAQGPQGDTGATGAAGADGATWSSGADVPANSTGTDGDFFFETDTDKVWKRISGTWTEVADLTGATGAQGPQGDAGDTGADGDDGLGVPAGGTADQVLVKVSATDNDTTWADNTGGHDIVDESGDALDTQTKMTFIGELVEATDNAGDSSTDITIDAKTLWLYAA